MFSNINNTSYLPVQGPMPGSQPGNNSFGFGFSTIFDFFGKAFGSSLGNMLGCGLAGMNIFGGHIPANSSSGPFGSGPLASSPFGDGMFGNMFAGGPFGGPFAFNSPDHSNRAGGQLQSVVDVVKQEAGAGINESNRKYLKYGQSGPWCAAFTDWAYREAGVSNPYSSYYVPDKVAQAKNNNAFIAGPNLSNIQPGDSLIFTDAQGPCHIGIVTEVSANKIKTVEGNSGNAVRENSYCRGDSHLGGYIRMS